MDKENLLVKGLSELGLTITEEQIEKFDKYYEMLIETNKVMNLTSITEYDEVIIKHFIDSLLVVNIFNIIPMIDSIIKWSCANCTFSFYF